LRKLFFFAGLVAPALIAPAQAACPAHVPGDTVHWVMAVCALRAETDDFESPAVQKCMTRQFKKDKVSTKSPPDCTLNVKYKKEWCQSLVDGKHQKSVEGCMKSLKTVPEVVKNGGA
jgi:hypothetical protein